MPRKIMKYELFYSSRKNFFIAFFSYVLHFIFIVCLVIVFDFCDRVEVKYELSNMIIKIYYTFTIHL